MSGILNSGKLATLLERITATRAGYLDAAISSRAAAATALSTATWTNARAAKLDQIGAIIPTTNGLKGRPVSNSGLLASVGSAGASFLSTSGSTSTYDSWTNVLAVTGAGVLEFLSVYATANASDRNAQARLSIDGNVVWTSDTDAWQTASDNNDGVYLVGSASPESLGNIRFASSFTLDFKKTENAAGTVTMATRYSYYLT